MSNNPAKFSRGDTAFVVTALWKVSTHNEPVTGVVVFANDEWIRVNIYGREYRFKNHPHTPSASSRRMATG